MSVEDSLDGQEATFNNGVNFGDNEMKETPLEPEQESQPMNNINKRVMEIQQADGIDVGPEWWADNVNGEGTEDGMFDQFTQAYERDFPRGADGKRHPRTSSDDPSANLIVGA